VRPTESKLEKELRVEHEKVQDWNDKFWRRHNTQFFKVSVNKAWREKNRDSHSSTIIRQ